MYIWTSTGLSEISGTPVREYCETAAHVPASSRLSIATERREDIYSTGSTMDDAPRGVCLLHQSPLCTALSLFSQQDWWRHILLRHPISSWLR